MCSFILYYKHFREADDKNLENIGVSNAIASLENHLNASKTIDADSFAFREMQVPFIFC